MRTPVQSLASIGGLRGIALCCGIGHRCGSDPALLWLWCRPEATAPMRPPSLGTSICRGCGPKKTKKKKKSVWRIWSIIQSAISWGRKGNRLGYRDLMREISPWNPCSQDVHTQPGLTLQGPSLAWAAWRTAKWWSGDWQPGRQNSGGHPALCVPRSRHFLFWEIRKAAMVPVWTMHHTSTHTISE